MPRSSIGEVTRLLGQMAAEDSRAQDRLAEIVYDELRQIAGRLMARERDGHSFQPTMLVNEAWMRLQTADMEQQPRNRAYFFAAAAQAMRRILIDHANARNAAKRGGSWNRTPLDAVLEQFESQQLDLIALHEALQELKRLSPQQHRVVEVRWFFGHTVEETAKIMAVPVSRVESDFRKARAFLHRQLCGD